MPHTRKNHPPVLKAKVAVEAIWAQRTTARIAQMFAIHPTKVATWKRQALAGLPDVFGNGREQVRQQAELGKDELFKKIGQLKIELDFSKKELASLLEERRAWMDPHHPHLSALRQCGLLGVPRSTYYYTPQPESAENLALMRQIDELYLLRPFFGSRRMAFDLGVNRKRVQRLIRLLKLLSGFTHFSHVVEWLPIPGIDLNHLALQFARCSPDMFCVQVLHLTGNLCLDACDFTSKSKTFPYQPGSLCTCLD